MMEVAQSIHEDNYRVYNSVIQNLKEQIKNLEEELKQLRQAQGEKEKQ